ncbi:unnamed protein product [Phaedon cochleariae]|uniref:Multidrug resistance-associated protein lethal(2)03659 n=1 Tax=Phaedon cochleariae TaxID=80249 RepID=A0A9N9SBY3_PHACE|nr:unnamed protein product [Phaedon cochleariae]
MDFTKENVNLNPRDTANPLSVLFFGYTIDLFRKGYRGTLGAEDLYNPLVRDRSTFLGDRLERNWQKQIAKSKTTNKTPSFFKALVATFWLEFSFLGILIGASNVGINMVQPFMLGGLLDHFKPETQTTKQEAFYYAGAIVLLNISSVLIMNQYMLGCYHVGMKIRAACCALIYRKSLKLSKTSLGGIASGKIVNLLSNDVSRFDIVSMFVHQMWVGPVCSLIVMGLLYREAGYAGIIGIAAVFLVVPIQSYTGKLSAKYRKQTALKTDERVRLMDEIISGIQVIKMYAWEKPFEKIVKIARRAEIKIITKSSYVRALFMAFLLFTTRFALFCSLLTLALSGQEITAAKVFVFMSYFNLLSMSMGAMFVRGISEIAELFVAIKRLQDFLLNEEFDPKKLPMSNGTIKHTSDYPNMLSLRNLTVKWNSHNSDTALENINLSIPDGNLVGIIGPVGSGKSSLLQTILGELDVIEGTSRINGTISYASQEPWVFAATIRQNIIFGQEYDKKRYLDVIQVCALEKDFQQFENGDLTIVGDRGASLSGGQKARINLARAVYREADIYLLDDPLSAVDIHVSKHLYEECINGYLANRTRILVTHQVHYLKDADHIIILKNGRIEDEGTFNDLADSENMYAKLLTADPEQTVDKQREITRLKRKTSMGSRKASIASLISEMSIAETLLPNDMGIESDEEEPPEEKVNMKDIQEASSKGTVGGSLLLKYLLAGTNFCVAGIIVILFILAQMGASAVDYFVSYWVSIEEFRNVSKDSVDVGVFEVPPVDWSTETCLYIYGSLLVGLFVIALTRTMLFYKSAMVSSKTLHAVIFNSVQGASMRFFDTNPGGRILNRFSKDMGSIDEWLPKAIVDSGQVLLSIVGSLVLIVVVNQYFLILTAVLLLVFGFLRRIYLKTSKDLKRLEGMMRSPVFTHLKATIEGLTTIRAFGAEAILRDEFDKHQDTHTSAWYMFIISSSAFGFYLDSFCAGFIAFITFSFLVFEDSLKMPGGSVGLAITQAIAMTGLLQWGMRQSAEVANQLMSVERVLEYKSLPKEIQPAVPQEPPKNWPSQGKLVFENMGLRYFPEGPLVLKHLNIVINPREKVGVVGRTGAGKSSLISALFRLAPVEGSMSIDDFDTKNISLESLRLKISIIPQDPVLFSGTLRYNLDPFEEYKDEALYRAIQDVELNDPANVINRLENRVMDRGANYSVGQRQLICLARAILRNNKILMLDEATANVDPQTDALIQKTIRRKFVDCTVLTVAHRLNTIMDSDKVLVMDAGTVAEFDHPHKLLQRSDSVFYKMVAETGPATSEQLRKVAADAFQRISAVPE